MVHAHNKYFADFSLSSSGLCPFRSFFELLFSVIPISSFSFHSFTDQQLVESMGPYLEQVREAWPWMLGSGLLGALIALIVAAVTLTAARLCHGLFRQFEGKSWRLFLLPERQPLIISSDSESYTYQNYRTAM